MRGHLLGIVAEHGGLVEEVVWIAQFRQADAHIGHPCHHLRPLWTSHALTLILTLILTLRPSPVVLLHDLVHVLAQLLTELFQFVLGDNV